MASDNQIDLVAAVDLLGYERIEWDAENDCYSGYGSSDAMDRSRDDVGGLFVASDDVELQARIRQTK